MQNPSDSDLESATVSTILAEVLPGIAVVFGEIPDVFKPDLIGFGLVSAADREQISTGLLSTLLSTAGNTATIGGNLGAATASAKGLYRLSDATRALLANGGSLAVKDGANLGTVLTSSGGLAQARFIPVNALSAAQTVAAIGPALAAIALQMQLSEITGLVRTDIALTSQVLATIRNEQWAELTGLVATVDRAIDQARAVESVPASLWDSVAGSEAPLRKQIDLYRRNVRDHVGQIEQPGTRRREYLQTNAEAIVFDSYALLSSVKAWTGYQAIRAGRARAAGPEDAAEARLVDVIARDTRTELDSALAETTSLVASLTRELRLIAETSGRDTLSQSLPGKRKDSKAARQTTARLLEAIEPLADALHPPAPALAIPGLVCAPGSVDLDRYIRILRWLLDDGETLRALGFPDQLDALGPLSVILDAAKEKLAAAKDKTAARTLVAVTSRRVITAKTNAFLERGEIHQDIPTDQVRYVRAATAQDRGGRSAIDLITREENIRWLFRADLDDTNVQALAAMLAESMMIPDIERDEFQRWRHASDAVGLENKSAGTGVTEVGPTERARSDNSA